MLSYSRYRCYDRNRDDFSLLSQGRSLGRNYSKLSLKGYVRARQRRYRDRKFQAFTGETKGKWPINDALASLLINISLKGSIIVIYQVGKDDLNTNAYFCQKCHSRRLQDMQNWQNFLEGTVETYQTTFFKCYNLKNYLLRIYPNEKIKTHRRKQ